MKQQNIYRFFWPLPNNPGRGEKEWVFSSSKKKACDFYVNLIDIDKSDLEECVITRVKKSEWKNQNIVDPDTREILQTFEDWVKEHGDKGTDIICTTAY